MPEQARYLMIASMDVDPEHEALFNEVYSQEHIPILTQVPGVLGAARYRRREVIMKIGGEERTMDIGDAPGYSAIFTIEHPDVLISPEWARAVEEGRWSTQVRPHTRNRRHVLLTIIDPS